MKTRFGGIEPEAVFALPVDGWCAVRRSADGKDWFDVAHSFSGLREEAERKAKALDQQLPWWSGANPVVRIARVVVRQTVEEGGAEAKS